MESRISKRALAALTLAAAMVSFVYWSGYWAPVQTFSPGLREDRLLIIDPGHGGEDGGAVSVSGVPESGINLAIALKCEQLAGLFGQPVQLLRRDDVSLASQEAETLRQKKRSDLEKRVEIINGASNAVLLSIHQNFFTKASYSGAQVFHRPGEDSRQWAIYVQEQLRLALDEENQRQAKEIPSDIYLMSHISCPAILVECGFLSNPEEDALLQTEDYQRRLAVTIMGACLGFFEEENRTN
ncbi:MAG: N-acetylmuramoyl-L-alanine amidase [Candidatus Onthomonas sp.]